MNYVEVKPKSNKLISEFIETVNLFGSVSTPVNLIFIDNFINNINGFKGVFRDANMSENIFFSCKANKCNALLKTAAECKCGIEVSSCYELMDALKYTDKIIASGPAKNDDYLSLAIKNNCIISVDDIEELKEIKKYDEEAKVLLRISDLLGIVSRFGINVSQIDDCLRIIHNSKIKLVGFSFHINNYSLEDRIKAVFLLVDIIAEKKLDVKYIDIGGGLPVCYCEKESFYNFLKENNEEMYFKKKLIKDFYPYYSELATNDALMYILRNVKAKLGNLQIIIEPGRSLLNDCGISIYGVKYVKHLSNGDNLVITDGNINSLSEQWFNSDYLIEPTLCRRKRNKLSKNQIYASVAGNLCLEQDIVTWRKIRFDDEPERGDFLIYHNTAGYQMDSNECNFHKIPLVDKYIVEKKENVFEIRRDYIS